MPSLSFTRRLVGALAFAVLPAPALAGPEVPRELAEYTLPQLRVIAHRGAAAGQYLLAVALLTGHHGVNDPVEAQHMFEEALKQEYPRAMRYVAHLHVRGTPPYSRDHDIAFGYLQRAAAVGDPAAPRELAILMKDGLFTEQTPEDRPAYMRLMLQIAADRGDLVAMTELAACLRSGFGGDVDEPKAREWTDKARQAAGEKPLLMPIICPEHDDPAR